MSILKQKAAEQALDFIEDDMVVGVGTGSTVNYFISSLVKLKHKIEGCVASSLATEKLLLAAGFRVFDLNVIADLPIYVDGADEVNDNKALIKGGGGALTREKIIAKSAKKFICIVDESKLVRNLGSFPIAIEVIPMARGYVARKLLSMGASPSYRTGFLTDNGNIIIDAYNLDLTKLNEVEDKINCITGVVENGIFANRLADKVIVAKDSGVVIL